MKKYNNMDNNVLNALNATAAATTTHKSNKNEVFYKSIDIEYQLKAELEKN